ncbi:fibronectin type III domain protein [Dictyocaulus viviparus]|uniref:Fibronectin type III domain protein n=1 Tax=Dictyocaulus viviparus TaxID=29172 RepID=A0A0D8Y5Z9_DICVI|nr:fibronectin type III domain protein [Dictyocaulus viviparus]
MNLVGNTTYRSSIEAFNGNVSLWYASSVFTTSLAALDWLPAPTEITLLDKTNTSLEISWRSSAIQETGHNAVINQHLIHVYEFLPSSKLLQKKFSAIVPIPKTTFLARRLIPGSVYNFTIQAGTNYGYGAMAWAVFSTLPQDEEEFILKVRRKTPNSLTMSWSSHWLPTPTAKFTISAKTLHSPDNIEKEVINIGIGDVGKVPEFVIRNLHPGSTYNVSVKTAVKVTGQSTLKWDNLNLYKTIWGVFSTLTQGEYVVTEPRIVIETESAASIVFQPPKHLDYVQYQLRYTSIDGTSVETSEYNEDELLCPKFGCEWLCALIFNLPKRPREYSFEVRVKVDGHWNKWIPIPRRPWNLLERTCSINPPQHFVDQIGNEEFMRDIDISSANSLPSPGVWRYLVVVDNRQSDFSSLDITKLTDRAASDYDNTPYYITASLSPEQVQQNIDFRLGDGMIHGGYLNYPLKESKSDPRWTLVPISQVENEILEPRLKTCGFTEEGNFKCDMPLSEFISYIPVWIKTSIVLCFAAIVFCFCVMLACGIRRFCENPNRIKEASIMYYHNDSPNTQSTTREYRKVERREFKPAEIEARMRFLEG